MLSFAVGDRWAYVRSMSCGRVPELPLDGDDVAVVRDQARRVEVPVRRNARR
jgi:hypothetical protein